MFRLILALSFNAYIYYFITMNVHSFLILLFIIENEVKCFILLFIFHFIFYFSLSLLSYTNDILCVVLCLTFLFVIFRFLSMLNSNYRYYIKISPNNNIFLFFCSYRPFTSHFLDLCIIV